MKRFNLRCYAIIINDQDELLLSDEFRNGHAFTKFVGGGLEWGEGTRDCLRREIKEEIGIDARVGKLYYLNDFFQQSAFNKNDQLISFYYKIAVINFDEIKIENHSLPLTKNGEKFRWKKISSLHSDDVTFPVDKIVLVKIIEEFRQS